MTRNKKIAACLVAATGLLLASAGPTIAQIASWYGEELRGSPTASGEPFDPDAMTAASRTLPLGSKVWVSNGNKSVQVEINDRGPALWTGKDIDLSRAAAQSLGISGVGQVKIDAADVSDEIEKPSEKMSELPKTGGIGG